MRVRFLKATASAIAISALCLTTGASFAATQKTQGHPDFTGVWVDALGIVSKEAPPFNPFQGDSAQQRNRPPLKPEYQHQGGPGQIQAENKAIEGGAKFDPQALADRACPRGLTGGMPGEMMPIFALEVVKNPKIMTVLNDTNTRIRHIFTDGRKHPDPDDLDPTPIGDSIGHWEGDTLVVDTIGITAGPKGGAPHSDKEHITERLHLVGDKLHDDITVEDPAYLTGPWKIPMVLERSPEPLIQYNCAENPRNSANLQIIPKGQGVEWVESVKPGGAGGGSH